MDNSKNMAKLTIEKKYGQVPNDILNSTKLSFRAKGLFGYLQSKPNGWHFSVERISQQTKDGKSSIRSGLKELEKYGFLRRKPIKNKEGKWDGYEYILSEKPHAEKPHAEKPFAENPSTDFPSTEKLATLSNKDNSNKDIVKKIINNKNDEISSNDEIYSFRKEKNKEKIKEKTKKTASTNRDKLWIEFREFWKKLWLEERNFEPEVSATDKIVFFKQCRKYSIGELKKISKFYLNLEKSYKYISMRACFSTDTINQYKQRSSVPYYIDLTKK